jgi:GTP cyclohydrolase IA
MRSAADIDSPATNGEHSPAAPEIRRSRAVVDLSGAQRAVGDLLRALGFDPAGAGLSETPRRVAAAFAELVTPQPFTMTTFPNTERYDGLVLARAIPFHSLCQHHLLPFVGVAHIGYLPADRIVGLSKMARAVDYFARGLQVQERLTAQIARCLNEALAPRGVAVVLEAEHQCMTLRGVQKPGTMTITSMLLGALREDARARDEFLTAVAPQSQPREGARVPYVVSRREAFNAAHQLYDPRRSEDENRRLFGKCAGVHGHNYVLEVTVGGDVDASTGYVIDLKVLSDLIGREIIEHVDHRNLNTDVPWLAGRIPTAENLAAAFWERLEPYLPAGALRTVRVWETEKNWAERAAGG